MAEIVCLAGPVEKIDDRFVLMIPLTKGGNALADAAKGISEIEGEFLKITIPDWLANELRLENGTLVEVDNSEGMFNIDRADGS